MLFSIVVHEISHGYMALRLGDTTARDMGRLTLNPIPHIDPIGSILIPLISFMTAGTVLIAWAKPVPVNPMNFRNMRRDDILVSVVGPLSNLVVALVCALLYVLTTRLIGPLEGIPEGVEHEAATFVTRMFSVGITLNIFLAVFNLIPVPPLDGSHVVSSLLPESVGERFRQIGFMGILIILILMRLEPFRQLVFSIVLAIRTPYIFLVNQLL
ncbi:MAG: site-2 protease family protein [Bacteroidota bacterium]